VNTFLDDVVNHLAFHGMVRLPDTNPSGPRPWAPPIWRSPPDGTPAPNDRKNTNADDGLVLGAWLSGEIAPAPGQGYSNRYTIDIDLRSKQMASIQAKADELRDEFAPGTGGLDGAGIPGLRIDWQLDPGGPAVIESRLWRGLQMLDASGGEGYTYRIAFLFELYR
jgi:hypothetical protein